MVSAQRVDKVALPLYRGRTPGLVCMALSRRRLHSRLPACFTAVPTGHAFTFVACHARFRNHRKGGQSPNSHRVSEGNDWHSLAQAKRGARPHQHVAGFGLKVEGIDIERATCGRFDVAECEISMGGLTEWANGSEAHDNQSEWKATLRASQRFLTV